MITRLVDWIRELRARRTIIWCVVFTLVTAISAIDAVWAVDNLALLTNVDRFVSDWEVASFTPVEPQDPDIVIVAITEETLQQFAARSPVDRQFLAELLNTIAIRKPRAIGLDLLLDQPTEQTKDQLLHDTMSAIRVPVIVSYSESPSVVTDRQSAFLNDYVPPQLRGLTTLATDQFDVVRSIYPGAAGKDGRYIPSFSRAILAAVGVSTPAQPVAIAWHGQPKPGTAAFKEYPAHLVKLLPAEWFEDKIVLIGTDLTLTDRHRTPFMTVFSSGEGILPGITIQANSVAQLLHGRKSPSVGWPVDLLVALACAAMGAGLGGSGQTVGLRVGTSLLFLFLLWGGGAASFHYGGSMISLIAPTLSLSMAFWTMEALSGREARRQREFIRGAFSRYVSPKVVEQLIQDPRKMSLEGERRVMTYLFTDVADFTTTSEALDSKVLARVLNAYLDGMTETVQKYDGMLDKFIGDAVFAIFNAPIDQPAHAEQAVRCALDIDRFAESFRATLIKENIVFGITRIGVHTGPSVIGNFGSRSRLEYTAQGDAVITASRLEGVNKYFGTRICVSEATRSLCPAIDFRPIASVALKGKSIPVDIWEPLRKDDPCQQWVAQYCEAFAKLKGHDPKAIELFSVLKTEAPTDPCVAFHFERLRNGSHGTIVIMSEK